MKGFLGTFLAFAAAANGIPRTFLAFAAAAKGIPKTFLAFAAAEDTFPENGIRSTAAGQLYLENQLAFAAAAKSFQIEVFLRSTPQEVTQSELNLASGEEAVGNAESVAGHRVDAGHVSLVGDVEDVEENAEAVLTQLKGLLQTQI